MILRLTLTAGSVYDVEACGGMLLIGAVGVALFGLLPLGTLSLPLSASNSEPALAPALLSAQALTLTLSAPLSVPVLASPRLLAPTSVLSTLAPSTSCGSSLGGAIAGVCDATKVDDPSAVDS
jgi:hypothetical protein